MITSSRLPAAAASPALARPWRATQPGETSAVSAVRSTARAPRSATVSTRARQSPSSGCCGRARATSTLAPADRSQPSSAARAATVSPSGMRRARRSLTKSATAASLARSGA